MTAKPIAASPSSGFERILPGFLLSGFLMALLGAILPAWGYHRDPPQFVEVGNYFLSLALGIGAATRLSPWLLRARSLKFVLVFACLLSCASLLFLALVSPPAAWVWRALGLLVLGTGAGLLNVSLFHALSPVYRGDPAGSVNRGGIWYGLGCLAATLLVAGTFYVYSVPIILTIMAAAPAIFAAIYSKSSIELAPEGEHPTLHQTLRDFISPSALLYAALLFFQFGNEWSVAGWLPLLLIRRIGMSPAGALRVLALYWLFLMGGRLAAAALLPRVKHARMLFTCGLAATFGCFMLFLTNNWFGAVMALVFLGGGFASLYPLVAEAIGRRFPYYHPGFFNGIFSIALLGGLLAPASLGYAAAISPSGVGVVIGIPLAGTVVVIALLLLIWLEAKISGR